VVRLTNPHELQMEIAGIPAFALIAVLFGAVYIVWRFRNQGIAEYADDVPLST
jgi:hypothetical protein